MFFGSIGVDFAQKQIGKKHLYTQKNLKQPFFLSFVSCHLVRWQNSKQAIH